MSLSQEQVPLSVEADLAEFLTRRFIDIQIELNNPSKFIERKEMPYKPQIGDIHYFGDPATHNYDAVISTEGFWGMTVSGWEKLNSESTGITGLGIWRYRTETGTPPASGQIRFDNADVSSATEFYLHETNVGGTDVSAFLDLLLLDGSFLYIQDQSNADNRMLIEVSSSVDNGAYRTYGIESIIEEGAEPSQNQTVILVVAGSSASASGGLTVSAEETGTGSETELDITIPAGVKRFFLNFANLGSDGTSNILIQLGDAGGIEASGYIATSANLTGGSIAGYSAGFGIRISNTTYRLNGTLTFVLESEANNAWCMSGNLSNTVSADIAFLQSGRKNLSEELTTVRLTHVIGTQNFSTGSISVTY